MHKPEQGNKIKAMEYLITDITVEQAQTDCVNDGKYVPPDLCNSLGCTKSVKQVNWVHRAVFGFKEAGLKLDVTTWVPRFVQSVTE